MAGPMEITVKLPAPLSLPSSSAAFAFRPHFPSKATAPTRAPAPSRADVLYEDHLKQLHSQAFSALRESVLTNDDNLVRRMREWEDRNRRRRASTGSAAVTITKPARRRRPVRRSAPVAAPPADEDDEEDEVLIHIGRDATLAWPPSHGAAVPIQVSQLPAAVLPPQQPSAWAFGPVHLPGPCAKRRACSAHEEYASDSEDDAPMRGVCETWSASASTPGSSPYFSAVSTTSDDDWEGSAGGFQLDAEDGAGANDKAVRALRLALASGFGSVADYEVDALLGLQAQASAQLW